MGAEDVSNRKLIKGMSAIKLRDQSLLLIRKGTELAKNVSLEELENAIKALGLQNIGIMTVKNFTDIGEISEQRLNQLGYYHFEQLPKIMKKLENRKSEEQS